MRKVLLAALAAALLPLPVSAHTVDELEAWQQSWLSRVEAHSWDLTLELAEEHRYIVSRHSWFFYPEKAPADTRRLLSPGTAGAVFTGMGSSVEQWRTKVALYFPADQVDRALRVMACESGGNPAAYNRSGASGLMQVLSSWADNFGYAPADLFDPDVNLYVASQLYFDGGWNHWVCKG